MNSFSRKNTYASMSINFKKFSRKGYAILNSMHKVVKISSLIACYSILTMPGKSQTGSDSINVKNTYIIDEIEVSPTESLELGAIAEPAIAIIGQPQIESHAHGDVQSLLRSSSTIDIRTRGANGIQSDISFRGGTFDQTNVGINNLPLNDPQTGHFSLSLPLNVKILNRIETFSSAGSRYVGINTSAGAINLVTKPDSVNSGTITFGYGSFNYFNANMHGNISFKNSQHLISASYSLSDGHEANTDFNHNSLYYHGNLNIDKTNKLQLILGYDNKSFGANGFYTPKFPNQYEHNKLIFGAIQFENTKRVNSKFSVYFRRLYDRFELFRQSEFNLTNGFYINGQDTAKYYKDIYQPWNYYPGHNHHINTSIGSKVSVKATSSLGTTYFSANLNSTNIVSNNIGEAIYDTLPVKNYNARYTKFYQRTQLNAFLGQSVKFGQFMLHANTILNYNTEQANKLNILPGAGLQIAINKKLGVSVDYVYTMNLPTFTDLFYSDPSNTGNRNLKAYYTHAIDARLSFANRYIHINTGPFAKFSKNTIDWVWFDSNNRFNPVHLNNYRAIGFETGITLIPKKLIVQDYLEFITINYTYLDIDKQSNFDISKYNHLSSKLSIGTSHKITCFWFVALQLYHQKRQGSYYLYNFETDKYFGTPYQSILMCDIKNTLKFSRFNIELTALNLFNIKQVDQGSVKQPGRWLNATLSYSLQTY